MTNHFKDISYYRNLDPLILYGDTWLYGAALPVSNIGVPKDVYVLHEKNYNIISWKNSSTADMAGYYVYRSTTIGHSDAKTIAIVLDKDSDGKVQTCYVDYLLDDELNTQYYYAVASINSVNFTSLRSEWAADMMINNSYEQIKYLYTNQTTQTYWSIIDLYRQLGNIDTDRNIIPYRTKDSNYVQQMVPDNYTRLYVEGEIEIDPGHVNPNDNIQPGYIINSDAEEQLVPQNVTTRVSCDYLYVTSLIDTTPKTYTLYMDDVAVASNVSSIATTVEIEESDEFGNLKNLSIDKFLFSEKIEGAGTYIFYWNDINNYWQYNNNEVNLSEFGITFNGTPQKYNVISVNYNLTGFVYFRVPYVYNSKFLQTYIMENDSSEKFNNFTFKTYNHLIFASTLGKVFNEIQIDLRESKGNLYVTDVTDQFVYKNFGSYFDFKQPAWMGNRNYRNCVLGDQANEVSGLWQAAMNGGTQLGMNQVITALSEGGATFSSVADSDYFTAYTNYYELTGEGLDLPEIKIYDPTVSNTTDDIVLYNDSFYLVNQNATISVDMFSSIDSTAVSCVNNTYKNVLFKKSYTEVDPLVITNITTTIENTFNKYDLVNINDHYYEVRSTFDMFYNLVAVTDVAPTASAIPNGSYYYNTYDGELYELISGIWEVDSTGLATGTLYLDSSTGVIYQYNDNVNIQALVPEQDYLRNIDILCSSMKFGTIPLDLNAIYKLVGNEYYLIDLSESIVEKDYIFKDEYTEDLETDPISYTRQYLLNTYEVSFHTWEKSVNKEKYLVYGNRIKLNNQNIIYPSASFEVYSDANLTQIIPSTLYTVDIDRGILIWNYEDNRPENGTYVWLNYIIDIRSDIKKLIELVKFPQVNIKYVWK